jgi:hypothetical protein
MRLESAFDGASRDTAAIEYSENVYGLVWHMYALDRAVTLNALRIHSTVDNVTTFRLWSR